jgi:hypothetical protein
MAGERRKKRYALRPGCQLPDCDVAEIPPEVLTDYSLSPDHEKGQHKARVFASVLGICREDWRYLRDQILSKLPDSDAVEVEPDNPWGTQWKVLIVVEGRNGKCCEVATCWEIPWGSHPRLTNAFIERKARRSTSGAGGQRSQHAS